MKTGVGLTIVLMLLCLGCAGRKPQHAPVQASQLVAAHSYVELEPNWRIRVVVPILKSGGYNLKLKEMKTDNGTVQLKAPDDFIGYEIDHYEIVPREGGGVSVHFESGEVHMNDGKTANGPEPRLPLFKLPGDIRYVRLAFLSRVTPTEHDAVILAASSRESINALTTRMEANPSQACTASSQEVCSWVPEGVSVQPEKKQGRKWIPAV